MLSVVKFLNSKFYQFLKFRVSPWMRSELSSYEDPPDFLEWSVGLVDAQIEKYECSELQS